MAGKRADAWRPLLYRQRLDIETIDRLADHVHRWRVAQEQKSIGGAVTSRLRPADLLGRISLGLAALVTLLLTASLASNHVDEFFGQLLGSVHSAILVTLLFLPLVAALGGLAFVWIAWQLNPEVAWVRRLIPLGTWTAGFTGLMIAGS